ncbi:MAG: thioredoxin fold domain-containing protein [Candidatus Marinimicrobia bacterium]|jgi:thiamine biosynthesis lipoprotein|nr:thioredoxin fold domain-containing protein [Candidatus Neomarinimicrobiota bacterium]MBT3634500.1 thioredoxin fold domain-containing protein [Candidatus Neomarinimicrobiota bacterium]MBT3683397.1 thioredoxin fold domain-containing protein [Candidatus Neomarinimicrobiota bacterium]MBT3760285.1 thioredoxin fold domain-containing protein [Candidatus Neomarinimicrobiota bacterium]MBT3896380.1 thioredoxin fold domain-containing protein [Candidatus Neomarinimicrobiota bacterium]
MKLLLFNILITLSWSFSHSQNWLSDLDQARDEALLKNQNIVLVFQGSDWCAPCIKLERELWSSTEFKHFAKDNFVLLKADFPKKKKNKLSKEQTKKNQLLADKYNRYGYFPFIVILDKNGDVLKELGYQKLTPDEYIKLLYIPPISKSEYSRTLKLMGSRFDITVVANDSLEAGNYIDTAIKEISRIEKLISSWDNSSQTRTINQNSGVGPVIVDSELLNLIKRANGISAVTDGAFDISYATLDNIWKFDGSMAELPSEEEVSESLKKVGYQHIIVDELNQTVFLELSGMKIGFGGIGKGYAADKAKELLISEGVTAGIINASGDMNTWGERPNGDSWTIAITNPLNKNSVFATLPIRDKAVVTSGNYQKFITLGEKKYSHILDPRTGFPTTGIISVTVFAPKAELADALATAVFVMGVDTGLDRINQMAEIECIIVDDLGNTHKSNNIKIETND